MNAAPTANGAPNGAAPGLARPFNFDRWKKLTESALAEGERLLAEAEAVVADAQAAIALRRREVDVLRRALSLEPLAPAPAAAGTAGPGRGSHLSGQGAGYRASRYLLEWLVVRSARSGDAAFTTGLALLACKGWPPTTVSGGLRRLIADGFVVREAHATYRLTESGRRQPPAPPGVLPLRDPTDPPAPAAAAGAHPHEETDADA